jgi:hypothetical protein
VVREHYQTQWNLGFTLWHPMEHGLRLWILWAEGGPLADGREGVVRWLYGSEWSEGAEAHPPLPDGYAHLCRTYRIWQISPVDFFIPLACHEKQDLLVEEYPGLAAWQQERLDNGIGALEHAFGNTVMTETLIEYVVAGYGREQLPVLMEALGQHASLETLIPAVFGVSTAEFEASWQAYLAEQYGVK